MLQKCNTVLINSKQDKFLNTFVDCYNSSGHKGIFFDESEKYILEESGFRNIKIEIKEYNWYFNNTEEKIDFCKNLFGLDKASDEIILNGCNEILGKDNFQWKLIYFVCTK